MDEYIKREDALRATTYMELVPSPDNNIIKLTLLAAQKVIRRIPAADVVEVVRCKDCKFFKYGDYCTEGKMEHSQCRENDFCSYGERKEQT